MIKIALLILALIVLVFDFLTRLFEKNVIDDLRNDKDDQDNKDLIHQGSWETMMGYDYDRLTCNVCLHPAMHDKYGYQQPTKYCPHCGSWMCDEEGDVLVDP